MPRLSKPRSIWKEVIDFKAKMYQYLVSEEDFHGETEVFTARDMSLI